MGLWQRVAWLGVAVILFGASISMVSALANSDPSLRLSEVGLALIGVLALGIGTSVLANAVVARMIAKQVFGVDVAEVVEALRGSSPFRRSDQEVDIKLRLDGGAVRVTAVHTFVVRHSSRLRRRAEFGLYTDIGRWASEGGFESVCGPDGIELRASDLRLTEEHGKVRFKSTYIFDPRTPAPFTVVTYGVFRLSDRLIWTIEQMSGDLRVKIEDLTGLDGEVSIKVNHHREEEIVNNGELEKDRRRDGIRVWDFAFAGAVLPFQGFEVQWRLKMLT